MKQTFYICEQCGNILTKGKEPEAEFALADGEELETVYAYCNLHSLWKA